MSLIDDVQIEAAEFDAYLIACTQINTNDLNSEYTRVAADIATWNARLARAYEKAALAKADYERERARTQLTIREGSTRKMTVDDLKAMVELDPDVSDAHVAYVHAEADRLRVKGIVDAVTSKRDMLQSLGAKIRAELAANPALREAGYYQQEG